MTTIDSIREFAKKLPSVTEETHFNLPAYKVAEKVIVVIQKGDTHAIFSVSRHDAAELSLKYPNIVEEVWRNQKIFVGVRVAFSEIEPAQAETLVKLAWFNKAPKSLQK